MDELTKKLTQLNDLLKAIKKPNELQRPKLPTIPTIKPPSPPPMRAGATVAPKIAMGSGPNSKKDPKKVAQQIKDGSMSTKTQKVMLKAQWSDADVEKTDQQTQDKLYHIHQGEHRITDKPLSIKEINTQHGGVQKLENSGFNLRVHAPQPVAKVVKMGDRWEDEPSDPASI